MANINLLPWREQLREERKQQFFATLGVVFGIAVVIIIVGDRYMNARISAQNERNNYLREQISGLDREIAEIRTLQQQKTELTARMTVIQDLQGTRPIIVRLFDELVRALPEGVYFNSIRRNDDSIVMQGVADSNGRISALMRALDDSEWFEGAEFIGLTALGGNTSAGIQEATRNQFQLSVKITTPEIETEEAL
jgi:type IV pilus assembly protein PilN